MNNDFLETHEIIDAECKIAAFEFSKYEKKMQMTLLKSIDDDQTLDCKAVYTNIETGYTVLNKENWMYDIMVRLVPILTKTTDDELNGELEESYKKCESSVNMKQVIKYIFEVERRRRRIFAEREENDWQHKEAQKIMEILGYQSTFHYDSSVFPAFYNEMQKKYKPVGMVEICMFNFGFIQGKRTERARRRKPKN